MSKGVRATNHNQHTNAALQVNTNKRGDGVIVTIGPGDMATVRLGSFRYSQPEPRFTIHYHGAGPHVVTHHITRLERDEGSYELSYQFQNFDDCQHKVTVQRQGI